jgi:hypothetical protein
MALADLDGRRGLAAQQHANRGRYPAATPMPVDPVSFRPERCERGLSCVDGMRAD